MCRIFSILAYRGGNLALKSADIAKEFTKATC